MIAKLRPGSSRFRLQNHDFAQVCLLITFAATASKVQVFTTFTQNTDALQSDMAHKEYWIVHLRLPLKMSLELPMTTNASSRFLRRARSNQVRYVATKHLLCSRQANDLVPSLPSVVELATSPRELWLEVRTSNICGERSVGSKTVSSGDNERAKTSLY